MVSLSNGSNYSSNDRFCIQSVTPSERTSNKASSGTSSLLAFLSVTKQTVSRHVARRGYVLSESGNAHGHLSKPNSRDLRIGIFA